MTDASGPRLSRRALFFGLAAAGALAGAGGTALLLSGPVDLIAGIVRRRVQYLRFDDADAYRFAQDWVRRNELRNRHDRRKLEIAGRLRFAYFSEFTRSLAPTALRDAIDVFERRVVTDFLLATDFFRSGMGPSAKVRYEGLARPCPNPFARFD